MTLKPMYRGVKILLYINDIFLGGQQNAVLNRTMSPIDITNRINGEWANSIAGSKHWSLNCSGFFMKDEEALNILEEAFAAGNKISVKISDDEKTYEGEALITNFPVGAQYNDSFTYNITLLGIGELR